MNSGVLFDIQSVGYGLTRIRLAKASLANCPSSKQAQIRRAVLCLKLLSSVANRHYPRRRRHRQCHDSTACASAPRSASRTSWTLFSTVCRPRHSVGKTLESLTGDMACGRRPGVQLLQLHQPDGDGGRNGRQLLLRAGQRVAPQRRRVRCQGARSNLCTTFLSWCLCLVLSWRLFDFITSQHRMCMGACAWAGWSVCRPVQWRSIALRRVVRCSESNADVCVCLQSCSVPALRSSSRPSSSDVSTWRQSGITVVGRYVGRLGR